jgi:hypothetical protein
MSFNVKTEFAATLRQAALAKPPNARIGVTGFWVASLRRVQESGILRIADLHDKRFVLEADIDAATTHIMVPERLDEYIQHELFKRSQQKSTISMQQVITTLQRCILKGRIVVAFRDARPIDRPTNHTTQNPVWYTEE